MTKKLVKKLVLVTTLLASSIGVQANESHFAQEKTLGNQASASVALLSKESTQGYFVDLRWQFSRYAEVALGLSSSHFSCNNGSSTVNSCDVTTWGGKWQGVENGRIRPRGNDISFSTTLRYPIEVSESFALAPFVELGTSTLKTSSHKLALCSSELVDGYCDTKQSVGENNNNNTKYLYIESTNISSFFYGAGIQVAANNEHDLRLGVRKYAVSDDWSNITVDKDATGAFLRYVYRPSERFGYLFGVESSDQFGDPRWTIGVNFKFN